MSDLLKAKSGMNIIGQGGNIILFTLPSLVAAILIHLRSPDIASLPSAWSPIQPFGYVLLIPGTLLWMSGVIQLGIGFPRGELVTGGAYGLCRNPIYSSFIVFILPAIAILTLTWVYLGVGLFLYLGVMLFIGREEKQLLQVFGEEYAQYLTRVSRIVPLMRPGVPKRGVPR